MDRGNWLVAAGLALVVALPFFATVNTKLQSAYRVPMIFEYYDETIYSEIDPEIAEKHQADAIREYKRFGDSAIRTGSAKT
jgi:hypothetical protein